MKKITIDGPAGSGKSTIAKILAKIFKYKHVNSGLFYRYLTFQITTQNPNLDSNNLQAFNFNEKHLSFLDNLKIDFPLGQMVINDKFNSSFLDFFEGIDLLPHISQVPEVRAKIKSIQKNIASKNNVIADGRDCGTVVFPDAQAKIFLTASLSTRTERIFNKLNISTRPPKEELLLSIKNRDEKDEARPESPLKVPKDAFVVDSSTISLDETIKLIICKIAPKLI